MSGELSSLPKAAKLIYEHCLAALPNCVTQDDLSKALGRKVNVTDMSNSLNLLLGKRLLDPLHQGKSLVYRAVQLDEAKWVSTMEGDEQIVYNFIKGSGNEGIWTKTLKMKTNLHMTVVNRCLKSLESKNLVKSIKSVKHPTRKIYMLYDLAPSSEITGGPWFTDQELDIEFINNLKKVVYKYIHSKSYPSKKNHKGSDLLWSVDYNGYPSAIQIHDWLRSTNITEVDLSLANVMSLVDVLVYDGKVEKRPDGTTFRAVRQVEGTIDGYTESPCGKCPLNDVCAVDGPVSPMTCEYFDKWLM
ncbi:DNA-directed RNA polymerase III complex subunit Rpc34 [Schizosaccharomyces japonicus yFS275]|uniref:DNA-directed RNA polymerase III subunit RPC6 n=1 Tax=Schizosaccharomyces japonicus (strain yFS275 / FY16936) TaxID=402676 RepID=B6K3J5_SCHJY|nr:DNA-directed RNA polymerase III complex subunit Rpc34 [Schizosaccharomyces japonicus yFS275]EEB08052.1 DNA-directed RNA polymerase III complex subunit Rpc34 [Schizosaccharomyces japonicus yFS275]